jgi:hypothetical protein
MHGVEKVLWGDGWDLYTLLGGLWGLVGWVWAASRLRLPLGCTIGFLTKRCV